MSDTRTCEACGSPFTNTAQQSPAAWNARRFCTSGCGNTQRTLLHRQSFAPRTCVHCREDFFNTSGMSAAKWARRMYCSLSCSGSHNAIGRVPARQERRVPQVDQPQADEVATQQLRDRTMVVFAQVAERRGLNDVWEAAVVCGMAA